MGLDIYAGTLTRYYAHNWKTVVQQWAEENGYGFHRVTPEGETMSDEEEVSPAEICEAVTSWRDQVWAAVNQSGREAGTAWAEDTESAYFTDTPDWDALGALLLTAACHIYGESVPATVEKDWNFTEEPLIRKMAENSDAVWSLFRQATWWLPLEDQFLIQGPLPTGNDAVIGTTAGLREELRQINDLIWKADEETILEWSRTEGYPADAEGTPGNVFTRQDMPEHTRYDTDSLAKFAFSLFYQAVQFAEEHRVPILLDY